MKVKKTYARTAVTFLPAGFTEIGPRDRETKFHKRAFRRKMHRNCDSWERHVWTCPPANKILVSIILDEEKSDALRWRSFENATGARNYKSVFFLFLLRHYYHNFLINFDSLRNADSHAD